MQFKHQSHQPKKLIIILLGAKVATVLAYSPTILENSAGLLIQNVLFPKIGLSILLSKELQIETVLLESLLALISLLLIC